MTPTTTSVRTLITRARDGDRDALGRLLEHHRVFGRIEAFEGDEPDQFVAWLRTIHEHNVRNVLRDHVSAQRRTINREQAMEADDVVAEIMPSQQSSPSQRLMQGERAVRLAAALQELAPDQREAVRLRYLEGLSLAEISEHTGRTKHSIAGLIKRGLSRLRKELRDEHH